MLMHEAYYDLVGFGLGITEPESGVRFIRRGNENLVEVFEDDGKYLVTGRKRRRSGSPYAAVSAALSLLVTKDAPACDQCGQELYRLGHKAICSACDRKGLPLKQSPMNAAYWFTGGKFYKFQVITPRLAEAAS